jgi:ubiquinone biosynthesis UbiH/UbiF/VisC/COQ6 family hydroxylase
MAAASRAACWSAPTDGAAAPRKRAGIKRTGWDYGQTALVCAIAHEKPHNGIAHQFFMPSGPLAILPLPGNRSSIVWSERTARAAEIAAMDDAAYLEALRPAFGDFLGEIALAGARYSYPLSLSIADAFVAPRLALVGDAAHGVHPIAGQGLNLGLRDVAALAEVLTDAQRRGEDIAAPDVLARYQTWRRFDTAAMAVATDAFNRLFSNDNPASARGARRRNGPGSGRPRPAPPLHPGSRRPDRGPAAPAAGACALTPRARDPLHLSPNTQSAADHGRIHQSR